METKIVLEIPGKFRILGATLEPPAYDTEFKRLAWWGQDEEMKFLIMFCDLGMISDQFLLTDNEVGLSIVATSVKQSRFTSAEIYSVENLVNQLNK